MRNMRTNKNRVLFAGWGVFAINVVTLIATVKSCFLICLLVFAGTALLYFFYIKSNYVSPVCIPYRLSVVIGGIVCASGAVVATLGHSGLLG